MISLFFISGVFFLAAGFFMRSKKFLDTFLKGELSGKIASACSLVLGSFALACGAVVTISPSAANAAVLLYLVLIILVSSVIAVFFNVRN